MNTRRTKNALCGAVAIAAAAVVASPAVAGRDSEHGKGERERIWSPVKQKMLKGETVVAKRVDSADPAAYCALASTPGTDFVWTDMVHSGLEYSYVSQMWAASCPTAVATMRGAEVFFSRRVNFVTKAYFRPPDPAANELQAKEVQRATDAGAMVIVINVDNAEQAREVVKHAFYPPVGERPLGPGQFDAVYPASVTGADYAGTYNDNVVVIAGISTVAGVSQAKRIADVPGIAALYLDKMNLESDSGYAEGTADYSKLARAVRNAAHRHDKYLCTADRTATPNTLTCVAHPPPPGKRDRS